MSRGRLAVQRDRAIVVVAHDRLRADDIVDLGDRSDRHHVAVCVAHVQTLNVVDGVSVRLRSLHRHLPGAAEEVEVVDIVAAERALQRGEQIAHRDAERLQTVAVDIEIELRRARRIGCKGGAKRRVLVRGDDQSAGGGRKIGDRTTLQVEQLVFEARTGAEAHDRRQVEGEDLCAADRLTLGHGRADCRFDAGRIT
ncbi:hypothetical protein D9M72_501260 [compost metagenome]